MMVRLKRQSVFVINISPLTVRRRKNEVGSYRSSYPEAFFKKGISKDFAGKFTGKRLCYSLLFDKVAGVKLGKEFLAQVFTCEFCEIFKTPPVAASES